MGGLPGIGHRPLGAHGLKQPRAPLNSIELLFDRIAALADALLANETIAACATPAHVRRVTHRLHSHDSTAMTTYEGVALFDDAFPAARNKVAMTRTTHDYSSNVMRDTS